MEQKKSSLMDKLDNIDYTHLLGYPPEVVAAEVITLTKEVVNEYINEVAGKLKACRDTCIFDAEVHAYQTAVRIVKGGVV